MGDLRITGQTKSIFSAHVDLNDRGSKSSQETTVPGKPETPRLTAFNDNADEAAYLLINGATFGLGRWALDKLGFTNRVDKESSFFKIGESVDTALGFVSLGGLFKSGIKNAGRIWNGISDIAVSATKTVGKLGDLSLGKTLRSVQDFAKATLGTATRLNYRKTFFDAFPHLEGKVVVHHAIEQSVLHNYPGVISEAELHSLQNLRGIPKDLNNTLHLSDIRKIWDDFYDTHPTLSLEDLMRKATEIDNRYGHLFEPPIR